MKHTILFALLIGVASTDFATTATAANTECGPASLSLQEAVKGKSVEDMLKLVDKSVSTTPQCACELIRSAIRGYKPTPTVVATMVDTAMSAAPDQKEVIVLCALATAPDAEAQILAVAEKVGFKPNPLDFPKLLGQDPRGYYVFTPNTPIFVNPPEVTKVNPK